MRQTLKIKPLSDGFRAPSYSTPGSAAFDIRSPEYVTIQKGEAVTIKLGFAAEIPEGHVAIICPRSGLGSKYGLGLRNTIGVIDSDYRGEWQATLTRDQLEPVKFENREMDEPIAIIRPGDRILQCMIIPVEQVDFVLTNELSETERGTGGYGSTGIK